MRLTGNGIDFKALKAGQDIEFEFDQNCDDDFNWDDENDKPIDYEKLFQHRNMDMIGCDNEDEDESNQENNTKSKSSLTPFETLRAKMTNISPSNDNGVMKRVLNNGTGIIIPNGSRVRSKLFKIRVIQSSLK